VATIQVQARRSIIGDSSQVDFWMNPRAGVGASSFSGSGGGYSAPSSGSSGSGISSGPIDSQPLQPRR